MSIDEDEIRQYLENKKLKDITLPDNSNDIDQGPSTANAKIGQKNLARAEYLVQRNELIKYGDKRAVDEYVKEQSEIRQRLEEQRYRQRLDYEFEQQEKRLKAIEAKITAEDIEKETEDIEALVRKRDKEIANVQDYFNCSNEFWIDYHKNGHEAYESPAGALITQSDNGTWACDIHRYQKVLEMPDGSLGASSFTLEAVENHFRKDPKPHLAVLIEITNRKYDKLIQERKEKTLEDKEVAFKRELRQIDSIKTRPGGDAGLVGYAATKITKGDKARIRREEEAENEKNRKIYRGLY